jgi:nicotinate-nucleotide adenylyltransferase
MTILKKKASIKNSAVYKNIFASLSRTLSGEHVRHSEEVSKLAQKLCSRYTIDPERGMLAGIGHDLARELSEEKMLGLLERFGKRAGHWEREHPVVLHGLVGRELLCRQFGIDDRGILEAVADHVLGRPKMGILSRIIFVADFLEPTRGFLSEHKRRSFLLLPLTEMLLRVAEEIFAFLDKERKPIAPISRKMYQYFLKSVKEL